MNHASTGEIGEHANDIELQNAHAAGKGGVTFGGGRESREVSAETRSDLQNANKASQYQSRLAVKAPNAYDATDSPFGDKKTTIVYEVLILMSYQDETNNATLSSWPEHEESMSS